MSYAFDLQPYTHWSAGDVLRVDASMLCPDVLRAHDAALEASSFAMISGAECMATCQVEKTMSCEASCDAS
eukprot:1414232-Amphidinium_carterae.1